MSGAATKAVRRHVRCAAIPDAAATPQGLTLNCRGQGRAFCARHPRIASLPISLALTGRTVRRRQGHEGLIRTGTVGFTDGYSQCSPCGESGNGQTSLSLTGQTSRLPQGHSYCESSAFSF